MESKSKKEISDEELDGTDDGSSARFTKKGHKTQINEQLPNGQIKTVPVVLQDKVIYEINVCPYCGSKATFHRRIQESGDIVGNVWRSEQSLGENGYLFKKFDYCLDCLKEFLIELYIWKKEKDIPNNKETPND